MGRHIFVACLALFCIINCSNAATAGRQPIQPIGVIQTQDGKGKDHVVTHPNFARAGKKPGTEVFRIVKFEPVVVAENEYGKFHTGDSYIVLNTQALGGKSVWDIYFWIGAETSQDESGAAAIYTVQLDDLLGGSAVQHREEQNHETQAFKSLFKKGIQYLPGGAESGLRHVDTTVQKKLYIVKGKKNIRVKEVEPSAASINKGDCFIYDTGSEIYVYQGPKSSRLEKLKSVSAANVVRDVDRNGRAKIIVIDEFNNQDELNHFYEKLGSGKLVKVLDESAGGDDQAFEKKEESSVILYKVSDASGAMKIDKITQTPIKQEMLDTNECFVLDADKSHVYVWAGRKSSPKEKEAAMKKAEDLKKSKNYPSWVKADRIIENAEPSIFRQYFQTWRGVGESHSRLIREITGSKKCFYFQPHLFSIKTNKNKLTIHLLKKNWNLNTDHFSNNENMFHIDSCELYVHFRKNISPEEKKLILRYLRHLDLRTAIGYSKPNYFIWNNIIEWKPEYALKDDFFGNEIPDEYRK